MFGTVDTISLRGVPSGTGRTHPEKSFPAQRLSLRDEVKRLREEVLSLTIRLRHLESKLHLTESEKFWARVKMESAEGCWIWTRTLNDSGYGMFFPRHKVKIRAHIWAYRKVIGPIGQGVELHHECRNKPCVNPFHMLPMQKHDHDFLEAELR